MADALVVRLGQRPICVAVMFGTYLLSSLIVVLIPELRWARAAYALTLLQYMAFISGFSKVNHGLHAWLYVAIIFVLLPKGRWRGGAFR